MPFWFTLYCFVILSSIIFIPFVIYLCRKSICVINHSFINNFQASEIADGDSSHDDDDMGSTRGSPATAGQQLPTSMTPDEIERYANYCGELLKKQIKEGFTAANGILANVEETALKLYLKDFFALEQWSHLSEYFAFFGCKDFVYKFLKPA